MDDLKQSVQTASYEQKDPLVIYKMEAFGLFKKLDEQINRDIVSFLCHAGIPVEQEQPEKVDTRRPSAKNRHEQDEYQ